MDLEFIPVGTIVNAHGVRGEVKLLPQGVGPDILARCKTFYLDGTESHYLYNHGKSDAKVLWITTPPMF